jgi:hypothetical protein
MRKSIIVSFVLLAVLVIAFAGCGSPANDVSGLWYESTGIAGTLEFKSGGVVSANIMGMSIDGTYTFDASSGKGTLTLMETDSDFELKDSKLTMDGSEYTRDKVEQQDLGDLGDLGELMQGLGDAIPAASN